MTTPPEQKPETSLQPSNRIELHVPDTQTVQLKPTPRKSLYRRHLPEPSVGFSSRLGRSYFESATRNNGLKAFFRLIEQHSTQSEPAYCGLSTLMIVLNSLAVDPEQTWKGPWRWYDESMLNCCIRLDEVKKTGITLSTFACLAVCQGLETELHYADDELVTKDSFRRAVIESCIEKGDNRNEEEEFSQVLVVSYDRKTMGQTGSGHFSPIAAYDAESDFVLIMDTARFKYGSHWVPLELLFDAMLPIDPDTQKSRGFVLLAKHRDEGNSLPVSVVFRSVAKQTLARRELKRFLQSLESVSYEKVYDFCMKDGPDGVWRYVEPNYKPSDFDTAQLVAEVRQLIQDLSPTPSDQICLSFCKPSRCRVVHVTPHEAIFLVYLAALREEERESLLASSVSSDAAKRQLLAEAKLGSYAIETCDELEL